MDKSIFVPYNLAVELIGCHYFYQNMSKENNQRVDGIDWTREPFPDFLIQYFREVSEETRQHQGERWKDLVEPMDLWIELVQSISSSYSEEEARKSVMYYGLIQLGSATSWSTCALFFGSYDSANRDMRFLLENMLQGYYLDQIFSDADAEIKTRAVQLLEKFNLRGSKLIDACDLPSDFRKRIKDIYRTLSGFIHPSEEVIRQIMKQPINAYIYDSKRFEEGYDLHMRVYDASFFFVLQCYPKAIQEFFARPHVLDTLDELGWSLCLTCIES